MPRRISLTLAAAALTATGALLPLAAAAEPRAVVLTNGEYQQLPDVGQTDASAAIAGFKQAGYRMVEGRNLTSAQIRGALADLLRADPRPGPRVVVLIGRFVHSRGDTWFLGTEAGPVNLLQADQVGVPMSVVIEAMAGGRPGSTLMLGTDRSMFPTGAGLHRSFGPMDPPEGVRVIVGYADGVRRGAEVLARPGSTLREVMSTAPSLRQVRAEDQRPPDPQEESAWQNAARTNTAAAYREFLSKYPHGRHAPEAKSRLAGTDPVVVPGPDGGPDGSASPVVIPPATVAQPGDEEMTAWARAKRANSDAGYREFLSKYPQSIFAGAARGRMGELQAPATPPNTAARTEAALALDRPRRAQIQRQLTLLSFDTGGIDGVFGDQTRRAVAAWQRSNGQTASGYLTRDQLARLDQAAARRTATLEAEAARVRAATQAADREYWSRSGAGGGRVGLQTYLKRFPDGVHADEARQALARLTRGTNDTGEAAAWTSARTANTMAAYREYLDKFPRGANAAAARQAHDALRARVQQDAADEARLDLDGVAMRLVESRLQQMGLDPGAVDGRFDAGTRQAIRRYQQDRNLTVSGYLNQGTIVRLLADTLLPQN